MKNYFDLFFEVLHKNSIKRRRMISLLLVLSMFVSSSVVWGLHGTVVTLVNEPIEEIDTGPPEDDELTAEQLRAHVHTDECYQDVLVCGFGEDDEHTHTEECYEKQLVCGFDDYDVLMDNEVLSENGEIIYESEDEVAEEDEVVEDDEEEITVDNEELSLVMKKSSETLEGESSSLPPTIQTIDNIAEGIKFTLFDYGDSNLESQNNHYGYANHRVGDDNSNEYALNGPPYEHNNISDSGINTDRNALQDILFFAYGTPVPYGANGPVVENGPTVFNGVNEQGVRQYIPDKNSYSGDYNESSYYSGNRPVQGIVNNTLNENGYPTVNADGNHSLQYLFDPSTTVDGVDMSAYKKVYTDVNHLLKSENGHLVYNSDVNYAYFNTDTKEFDVYNTTFDIVNDNHHKANETNYNKFDSDGNPIVYGNEPKDPGFKIGFFPFDEYDASRKDPNFDGNGYNHHFGMTMEASFNNPHIQEGATPITFKYSGDDDMWVFVDGHLVLDIGGIHEPTGGMIDFSNGLVWVQDNEKGVSLDEVRADLISKEKITSTDAAWEKLPKPIGIDTSSTSSSTSSGTGNKWIVKPITDYISNWYTGGNANGKHEIKMFYLERGGCYSNLAMEMNLPTLKPLTVMKNVDYQQHLVKDPAIDNKEYTFQVWEWDSTNGIWVIPQSENSDADFYLPDNHFTLKDGQRKTFDDLEQHRKFKIVEEGVDPNIYDRVQINGTTVAEFNYPGGSAVNVSSGETPVALSENNSYIFNNRVIEDTTSIHIKKAWDPAVPSDLENFVVKYKIMRTDVTSGEVKQVALRETDPNTGKVTKTRIFTINPDKWTEGDSKTGLLSRYGNHFYTYDVEELNVPANFKVSYSTDQNGNITITNTDLSRTDIYVKKQWDNHDGAGYKVNVKLTRKKVGYSPSQLTSLTVNILDEGGNLIKSETFGNVYTGGSAEIPYYLPEGVVLYKGDQAYPQKAIGDAAAQTISSDNNGTDDPLYVKFEEDEGILVVNNLSASSNTVTFKVTSDDAEDSMLLLHHSYTRGPNGWTVQNDPTKQNGNLAIAETSSRVVPYAKGDALLIKNRTKAFNGAMLKLDPDKFKANKTYTFSVYVYSPVADNFKMTFVNGLGGYKPITDYISVSAGEWTQITGTVQLNEKIDPYNMSILIETEPVTINGDNEACRSDQFRMDEFTAIEGTYPVTVSQQTMDGTTMTDPGGIVTIGEDTSSDKDIYYYDFSTNINSQTGLGGGWILNDNGRQNGAPENRTLSSGPPNVDDSNAGRHFVRVWGRDHTDDGIKKEDVSFLQPGHTYRFEVQAQHVPGDDNSGAGADDIHLTLYVNGSGVYTDANNPNNHYPWVCTVNIPDQENDHYHVYQNTGNEITIPTDADVNNMFMYFGTNPNNTNKYGPFRIWHIKVTEVGGGSSSTGFTEPKDGYKINEYGQYVSNYSNYRIELDPNSVTSPLTLDGDYTTDMVDGSNPWSREVTLEADNGAWTYHWQNYDITDNDDPHLIHEDNGFLYEYHVEEVSLIKPDGTVVPVIMNTATNDLMTSDENFLVTYSGNDVANNTVNSPMLITNKYIWYKLPDTGGIGTDRVYLLSLLLITTGILSGCCICSRKRRRE